MTRQKTLCLFASVLFSLAGFFILAPGTRAADWTTDPAFLVQQGLLLHHFDAAYNAGLTGAGVTVAVFDTGIDVNHEAFQNKYLNGGITVYDFAGDGLSGDPYGHGSFVAGEIGADRLANYMGGAYHASLISARIWGGLDEKLFPSWTQAFNTVNGTNARIYNLSQGLHVPITDISPVDFINKVTPEDIEILYPGFHDFIKTALDAVANNKLVVFSAGNESSNDPDVLGGLPYWYPELKSSWLNVVATDAHGNITFFSNGGGVGKSWTIAAFGDGVHGVVANTGNGYTVDSGTSMAAPQVSAAAALVWEKHPNFTAAQVAQTLLITADEPDTIIDSLDRFTNVYDAYGWGILNVANAIQGPAFVRDRSMVIDDDFTFSVDIGGAGGFTKLGAGNLYFTGVNSFGGALHVSTGTVYIDGSQASPVFVDSNGLLRGSGVINNTVSIGGTLYPGHSPGTLTVNGSVTQAAGSTFGTDLAGTAAGTYGKLVVSGAGHAYTAGGTLAPNRYGGYLPVIGDYYQIVTAQGGISGQYAALTPSGGWPAGENLDILYHGNDITLYTTPANYQNPGWNWNKNQAPVAAIWQHNRPAFTDMLNANQTGLYNAVFPLNQSGLQSAAGQMSGQLIADSQAAGLDQLGNLSADLHDGIKDSPVATDGNYFKLMTHYDGVSDGDLPGRNLRTYGCIIDHDLAVGEGMHSGIGFSYANGVVTSNSGSGNSILDCAGVHFYGQYGSGGRYLQWIAGLGATNQRFTRELTEPSMFASASGSAPGIYWLGRLSAGVARSRNNVTGGVEASLAYESLGRNAFQENGDSWFALSGSAARDNRFSAELNYTLHLAGQGPAGDYQIGWRHTCGDPNVTANLTWLGSPMNIASAPAAADIITAGAAWQWDNGWQLTLQGEKALNGNGAGLEIAVKYVW